MEYDAIGRPTKITYPKDVNDARKELKPKYNKAGALYSVLFDSTEYVKEIAYNAKGQRLLLALGNGVMTRYAYSNTNFRLLRMCTEKYTYTHVGTEHKFAYDSATDTRKQDLAYLYDLKGNIKSIKTTLDNSGYTENYGGTAVSNDDELTRKFKYDAINRLIEAIGREAKTNGESSVWSQPTKTNSPVNASGMRQYKRNYEYDKLGNVQELQHLSGTNSFTRNFNYRTGLNQLSTIDDNQAVPTVFTSYTHDANGNQTQLNTERFLEWDYADQLKLFKIDNGTATKWAQYRYSGGQRIKKVSSVAGGNYTTSIYIDGIFEYQFLKRGSNTYERNYSHIMDDSKRIAQVRAGSAQEDIGDSVFYVVDDHLGTSTLRLKSDATLIDRQEYYPFGETSLRTFDYKRYQYVGKERDDESGLYYYGARYYSAWTCRFIGVDPLAEKYPQLTPYNYAGNKPINHFDIDGMQSSEDEGGGNGNSDTGSSNAGTNDSGEGENIDDDNIVFSPDGKRIYNIATNEKSWDYGILNEETGSFDLHKIDSKDGYNGDELDALNTIAAIQNEESWVTKRSQEIYDNRRGNWEMISMWGGVPNWDESIEHKKATENATEEYWIKQFQSNTTTPGGAGTLFGIQRETASEALEPSYIIFDVILFLTTMGAGNALKAGFRGLSRVGMEALATASGVVSGRIGIRAVPVLAMNGGMEIKIAGWIEQGVWKGLSKQVQKKFAAALKKGIVPPKGNSGIIKLTESEIKELAKRGMSGYTHKVKILGEGVSHYRVYGIIKENGQFVGSKLLNT